MSREQCPLCLGYTDEPLVEVCGQCNDNAASFDITKMKLDKLVLASQKAKELLGPGAGDYEFRRGYAWGLLNGALLLCVDKESNASNEEYLK